MRHIVSAVLIIGFLSLTGPLSAKWELSKNNKNVKVYTQEVTGSDMDEFKGITTIPVKAKVIENILKDIPSFTKWFGFCKEIKLIKKYSENHLLVYVVIDAPWPTSDRETYVDVKYKYKTKNNLVVNIRSVKYNAKPKKGRVRMPSLISSCNVKEKGGNSNVVYYTKGDPGGSLPSSMANWFVKKQPFKTLVGLKKMAKKSKYK